MSQRVTFFHLVPSPQIKQSFLCGLAAKCKNSNIRRTFILIAAFLIGVIGIGWLFSRIYGNPSILYFAVVFSLLMNVISFWYSDKIVLAMTKAKPVEKKNYPELFKIVGELAKKAVLPAPKIYIIDEAQPNAFATGRNSKHAAIAVTTGLLQRLNAKELEGVLAHELSHIANRDILISTIVVVLVGFISIVSDIFLRSAFFGGFRNRDNERGGNQIFAVVGIILAIVAPISAMLIQLAISRKREFLADASGAVLTKNPSGLASALEKISASAIPMKIANNATAHLWVDNPFKGAKLSGIAKLFMTHPPVEERIKALEALKF
ncbi:MAG: zinc metalloprotease HtpX [Patescibacteria group bacterium]